MKSLREKFCAARKNAPPLVRITLTKIKPWKSYVVNLGKATDQPILVSMRHVNKDGYITCTAFLQSGTAFTTDLLPRNMAAIPERAWNDHYRLHLENRTKRLKQQDEETRQDLEQAQHDASQAIEQPSEEDFTSPDGPVAHNENPAE